MNGNQLSKFRIDYGQADEACGLVMTEYQESFSGYRPIEVAAERKDFGEPHRPLQDEHP
ncbi:Uncharacterised protein [uncultured archaeon]|nr:Uncharacterised protein [uncultured archaeon]